MRYIFTILVLLLHTNFLAFSQPWSTSGTCDFTDGQQWNNGGAKGCACTWYSVSGTDTILNCAFGDCGQNALYECIYDCNGHNGYVTDMIARTCDASATPICWFNGAGSAGELFCAGLALPVEFINMIGYTDGAHNYIEWSTSSEYNSSHFIIERSIDGIDYEYVATVLASGNTTLQSNYRVIDVTPYIGTSYYKLLQYDYDGAFEILKVISIDIRPKEILKIINLMGQEVDKYYNGIKIVIFEDGTTIKTI